VVNLKDKLLLEEQSIKLSLEQGGSSFRGFLGGFPRGKRILLLTLALAIIPAVIAVRVGARLITERSLAQKVLTAHPSYAAPVPPSVSPVTVLKAGSAGYSAYAQVANANLDLSAPAVPYQFNFYNSKRERIATVAGTSYLLPNQKKYIVVPRVDTGEQIASADMALGSFQWQKRLAIPQISLKADTPFISTEVNPLALVAEGAVVNNSPYDLGAVQLVFLLYDKNNSIVAVSQRDEFTIPAFGRRGYRQTWPGLGAGQVARAVVLPDTNALDNNNVASGSGSAPTSRPPAAPQ
jgi:hypothetical protein